MVVDQLRCAVGGGWQNGARRFHDIGWVQPIGEANMSFRSGDPDVHRDLVIGDGDQYFVIQ
jgi:hypothetical protein